MAFLLMEGVLAGRSCAPLFLGDRCFLGVDEGVGEGVDPGDVSGEDESSLEASLSLPRPRRGFDAARAVDFTVAWEEWERREGVERSAGVKVAARRTPMLCARRVGDGDAPSRLVRSWLPKAWSPISCEMSLEPDLPPTLPFTPPSSLASSWLAPPPFILAAEAWVRVEYRRSTTAKGTGDFVGVVGVEGAQPLEWHLWGGESVMEIMGPKGVPMLSLHVGSRGTSLAQCGLLHSWLGSHVQCSGTWMPCGHGLNRHCGL